MPRSLSTSSQLKFVAQKKYLDDAFCFALKPRIAQKQRMLRKEMVAEGHEEEEVPRRRPGTLYDECEAVDWTQTSLHIATSENVKESLAGSFMRSMSSQSTASAYTRFRMLIVSGLLVVLQVTLLHQLLAGLEQRTCAKSSDCIPGTSCTLNPHRKSRRNACAGCEILRNSNETRRVERLCHDVLDDFDLLLQYQRNQVERQTVHYKKRHAFGRSPSYEGEVFLQLCAGCVTEEAGYLPFETVIRNNVFTMRRGDYLTLLLCSIAVALAIVDEIGQILVAEIAQKRRLHATLQYGRAHSLYALLLAVRTWILIPKVVAVVPRMVAFIGADTASQVFNTVAVIFVLEVDNWLSDRLLSRRSRDAATAVVLTDDETRYISRHQKLGVFAVVCAIFMGLIAEGRGLGGVRGRGSSLEVAQYFALASGVVEVIALQDRPHLTRVLRAVACANPSLPCCFCTTPCCCRSAAASPELLVPPRLRKRRYDGPVLCASSLWVKRETADDDDDDGDFKIEGKTTLEDARAVAAPSSSGWLFPLLRDIVAFGWEWFCLVVIIEFLLSVVFPIGFWKSE